MKSYDPDLLIRIKDKQISIVIKFDRATVAKNEALVFKPAKFLSSVVYLSVYFMFLISY